MDVRAVGIARHGNGPARRHRNRCAAVAAREDQHVRSRRHRAPKQAPASRVRRRAQIPGQTSSSPTSRRSTSSASIPNYAEAYKAWKAAAQRSVDNAHMRYFIVHMHRLLDPDAAKPKPRA